MSTFSRVPMTAESRPFVCGSFCGSFSKYSGLPNRRDFDRLVVEPFDRALDASPATVVVLADSPDDFVAWVLVLGPALVYAYVKEAFRDRGIGRSLLPAHLTSAVYQTPAGMRLQRWKFGRVLRHSPYALHAQEAA